MHPAQASPSELIVSSSSAATRRPSVRSPPKRRPTCPRVRTPPRSDRRGSPDPRQHPVGPGHQPGIRPVIRDRWRRGQPPRPGFLPPFGRRPWLVGSSCSRRGPGPSLRSAYQAPGTTWRPDPSGLPRSAPARYGRGGCPHYPGDGGALPGRMPCPAVACRFPAASPCTPHLHPTSGAPHYGASTRVHAIHPSGLPLACGPRMGRGPSGVPLCSAPRCYQRRTTGRGRASSTRPELRDRHHRPSNPRVHSQGATSCRNGICGCCLCEAVERSLGRLQAGSAR
jgi:hypothetical protein